MARGRYETVSQVQDTKQVSDSLDEDRIEREGDGTGTEPVVGIDAQEGRRDGAFKLPLL